MPERNGYPCSVWRVACAIADIVAIALSPEVRDPAAAELDRILAESG